MIPDAAIEAAALAAAAAEMQDYDALHEEDKRFWIRLATPALEAAAPYIAAAAWDEGWQACVNYSTYPELDGETPTSNNPYRPAL